jgi:hypothetical protein
VTGDGTNSSINAGDSDDATVAGSVAIQLNVAMLRLAERKQPGLAFLRSLLIKMRLLTVGVVLF